MIKARAYLVLNKLVEAMYIVEILINYAQKYRRVFFLVELHMLKAIILYRRKKRWESSLLEALNYAYPLQLTSVIIEQGAAIYPLLKAYKWGDHDFSADYVNTIVDGSQRVGQIYTSYLQSPFTIDSLSKKERQVLDLVIKEYSNAQIAETLFVSVSTVKFHVANLFKKFNVNNRYKLINHAEKMV